MRGSRDPKLIDMMTWAVAGGARTFRNVRLSDDARLVAAAHIKQYDFVIAVPTSLTFSMLNIAKASSWPQALRPSPRNYGSPVRWFPGVNWGMLAYTSFATFQALSGVDAGRSAQLTLIAEFCAEDDAFLTRAALEATQTNHFAALAAPLIAQLRCDSTTFAEAFSLMYCGLRRTSLPLWTQSGGGSKAFAESPFVHGPHGDVIGSVPLLDLARHSSNPSALAGAPEAEALEWLVVERGLERGEEYWVLQAARDLYPGDDITIDRNLAFGFGDQDFSAWFGRPWDDARVATSTDASGNAAKVGDSAAKPQPGEPQDPDDLFY